MSLRHIALVGCVISVSAAELGAEPKKADRSSLYFPVRVGTKWVYEVKTEDRTFEIIEVITHTEEKDGRYRVFVGREADGKVTPLLTAEVSADGVAWISAGDREYKSPSRQVKLPVKNGEKWAWQGDDPEEKIKMSYRTVGEEEVEVAAGKHRAVRVEATSEFGGKAVITTDWFAPAVGRVRSISKIGDRETVVTLKQFTPGKE
jgi:hypothetical protein